MDARKQEVGAAGRAAEAAWSAGEDGGGGRQRP